MMAAVRDLLDEKLVKIIEVFDRNPGKRLYLTDISEKSGINMATTYRIVNKLVQKEYVKVTPIGKMKVYSWGKNEKARALQKILLPTNDPTKEFIDRIQKSPRLKKIILATKKERYAKIVLVGDFIPMKPIEELAEELQERTQWTLECIEFSERQYEKLKEIEGYEWEKKIAWERN